MNADLMLVDQQWTWRQNQALARRLKVTRRAESWWWEYLARQVQRRRGRYAARVGLCLLPMPVLWRIAAIIGSVAFTPASVLSRFSFRPAGGLLSGYKKGQTRQIWSSADVVQAVIADSANVNCTLVR
jgi:hypothetical protein